MANFQQAPFPFADAGINLSLPVDRMPKNRYRLLENTRSYGDGHIQGRQGTDLLQPRELTAGVTNSMFTLNDPVPSPSDFPGVYVTHARLAGIGTELWGGELGPLPLAQLVTGLSGKPLSFTAVPSDLTPRPWVLVGDSAKMRKVASSTSAAPIYQIGIAPPNFVVTIALGAVNADGPDVGTTNNPYVYALRARGDSRLGTGALSNLGPAVRDINGLSPAGQNINITIPSAHPDPQVRWLDVFRYGGSIIQWTLIGTVANTAGATLTDKFNDLAIASNQIADQTDNQPFLTVDPSRNGTCTITSLGAGLGSTLTITAGDTLRFYNATGDDPYYPAGTQISINGVLATFYRSPDSATSVELLEDVASVVGANFFLSTPEKARTPLPCMWGPYGGGVTGIFVFGVGDPLNPGNLYWTKGNHPESHPGTNSLTLTSGSETLMNGIMYGGNPFAFSTQRLFQIYPTLGQTSDFSALEVPNSKGLFAKWGLCVTPLGIAFVAKDGIYLTAGGPPVSLTNQDLYPLFPHEGTGADAAAFPVIDGMLNATFSPPDFSQTDALRLAYGDGFLYFDFIDQDGNYKTLVYNFVSKSWVSRDTYHYPVACHYFEVVEDDTDASKNWTQMLLGEVRGQLAHYTGTSDYGFAIAGHVRTRSNDNDNPRPRCLWGDVELDLDTECDELDIEVGMDNFTYFTNSTPTGLNYHGRRRAILDINAGLGQYGYNLGLDITWSATTAIPILYFWLPTWIAKPELTALRVTDLDDCGYPGAKFIQGFKLRADTLNVARTVQVLDQDGVAHSFTPATVLHPREETIAYSFDTPFITHLVRLHPTDAQFWRVEGVEFVWEPAPELVRTWTTQETTFDFDGWLSHRDAYLPIISSDVVTLTVNAVGNPLSPFTYTTPSTAGAYDKIYKSLQAMKCRAVSYSLTSPAGFRVYQKDFQVNVKAWNSTGRFLPKQPMGDLSRINGARI